jgi:hypothetical protein
MEADELAYLDQLHERATVKLPRHTSFDKAMARDKAQKEFIGIIMKVWPEISALLPKHDHSL